MSARRGPYRRHARLRVQDTDWKEGDTVIVGRTRWLIIAIASSNGAVTLHSSSTVNHLVVWNTTLDRLPERTAA